MSRKRKNIIKRNRQIVRRYEEMKAENKYKVLFIMEKLAEEFYLTKDTVMNIIYRPESWQPEE